MIFKERQSIYLQIAERISDEILAGTYAPGSRVPSVREYAVMIEVNLNTVMRSYDTLQSWGILEMKRGLGYFVADNAVQTILARRREAFISTQAAEFFETARTLGVSPEELTDMYLTYLKR